MHALVVGRFQPLHHGHVAVIRKAIEDCVNVTVAIGSTNARESTRNPFSFDERRDMLTAVFGETIRVLSLPDIHDPPRWVDHVQSIVGNIDRVYGNDSRTIGLFEDADIPAVATGLVERQKWEASTIRMQMAEGDPSWERSVPKPVAAILKEVGAERRLRLLEATA